MPGDEGNRDDDEVIITVPADMHAGVWANWAVINESDHAFRESRGFRCYPSGPTRTHLAPPGGASSRRVQVASGRISLECGWTQGNLSGKCWARSTGMRLFR
jgi:hypothetical protein